MGDLSPSKRLFITEAEIVTKLYNGVKLLLEKEAAFGSPSAKPLSASYNSVDDKATTPTTPAASADAPSAKPGAKAAPLKPDDKPTTPTTPAASSAASADAPPAKPGDKGPETADTKAKKNS